MGAQVLVAFATKYGATGEIAERIGSALRQAGVATEVIPVERVGDITPYKAIVLGSAVYIGKWRKEAASFLRAHERALAERMVWLFSSGPTGKGDVLSLMHGWRFPQDLQPIADRIHPRDVAVFHGRADAQRLNPIEKWVLKNVKAPLGDFRDWEAVSAWAATVADQVKQTAT